MKRPKEQFKRLFRLFLTGLLVAAQTAVFSYVWLNYYNDKLPVPYVERGNWFLCALFALLLLTFLHSFDSLKFGRYRKSNIIISQTIAIIFTSFFTYLIIVLLSVGFVSVIPILLMTTVEILITFLFTIISDFWFSKIFPSKKVIIIYDEYDPEQFIAKLQTRKDKFRLKELINVSVGLEKIEEAVKESEGVIIYDVHAEMRNKLLKICFENNIRAYATTKISDVLVREAECLHLFDTPLLLYRNNGMTIEQRFIKRAMDIFVSFIMLILTSPIMLICAIAIKICDKGPVFFRQPRVTLNGKVFNIHKFRTMIVDAEKDGTPIPAQDNDPRVTPIGKFLRASRLDELPQLIDILVGNMSLVGPRPERVEHVEAYTKEVPEFQYRLKVRGGLTGYAQLYGKYNTHPYDKLQLDLMYIQNYSLLLDIKLLLMTVKIMFMKESTDGFEEKKDK